MKQGNLQLLLAVLVVFVGSGFLNCINAQSDDPAHLIPLTLGNFWIYEVEVYVNDSLMQSAVDTTLLTETKHWGGHAWLGPRGKRGQLMRNSDEGVWNFRVNTRYPKGAEFLIYPYPAEVGKEWDVESMPSKLISVSDTITVPAGEFTGCYQIFYNDEAGNSEASVWIKPGVGKVMVRANVGTGERRTTYVHKLKEFHIE